MNGKFILLSGSTGFSCPSDKLDIACQFVRDFTGEALRRGGGIVVLAGDEESTKDEHGTTHIFDWLACARSSVMPKAQPKALARTLVS